MILLPDDIWKKTPKNWGEKPYEKARKRFAEGNDTVGTIHT